ncbi:hypothetical protein IHE55_18760 [Streptomyces pactum]|uniref:DUF7919 domain-containing protein n=2 Tax=Streptomyces pactum TaxID=68249 RepID=A0ABS0NNC5_9ACTN|nr:hypothetical protein [Streptomyces pactum]
MTYFTDLSPYSYLPNTVPSTVAAFNVGWLDGENAFHSGEAPDEFIGALADLCAQSSHAKTRGWHVCNLVHASSPPPYPITMEAGGRTIVLGSAEVRVVTPDGAWLVAPDLVLHYVIDHKYLPPEEFVEAVMAKRNAPSGGPQQPSHVL